MQQEHMTWGEFMDGTREQSGSDHLLRQAIAKLTTEPAYHHKTPEEVYGELVEQDRAVRRES